MLVIRSDYMGVSVLLIRTDYLGVSVLVIRADCPRVSMLEWTLWVFQCSSDGGLDCVVFHSY